WLPGTIYTPGKGFLEQPIRLPIDPLARAALAVGHNYAVRESHDTTRRMLPFVDAQTFTVPSLGLAAALAAEPVPAGDVALEGEALRIGTRRMPLSDGQLILNFHGPHEADSRYTYPTYSFFDVLLSEDNLESGQKPSIDPAVFRDKIVFVGTSASGLGDV